MRRLEAVQARPHAASAEQDWRQQANCRHLPVDEAMAAFFPLSFVESALGHPVRRSVCGACPVRQECKEYGQETRSVGWWGNWTAERWWS